MTILDTFYILFKTNSDDVKKGFDVVDKRAKETEKSLKATNELTDALGRSFVKLVEAGVALTAGFFGVDAIKDGILDVAKFNAGLGRTADLAGQSAQSLKQMGQAALQVGGSREGAIQNIQEIQAHYAALGKKITPEELMEGWREALAGKNKQTQAYMLQQFGVRDIGLATQAELSANDFKKNWAAAGKNTETTGADIKTAQDFVTAMSEATAAFEKLEQVVGKPLLEAFSKLLDLVTNWVAKNNEMAESVGHTLSHPLDTAKTDADFIRDWIKNGGISSTAQAVKDYDYKGLARDTFGNVKDGASSIYDWWNESPNLTRSVGRPKSSSSSPPALNDPMTEWHNAVTNPDYIKSIQATGQSDMYATEATKAFSSQVNHINGGKSNTINVQSVTVNTQATDGRGTADAFQAMLHDLAANHSDGVSK